jgi:CheY-like chemotaxis protein
VRILLVEHHADSAVPVARLLGRRGHAVHTVPTAAEAIALCDRESFDLLVADIGLPDLSGWELVRRLRGTRVPRAIALTGYGTAADVERSGAAGFDAHLTKPVDFTLLVETVTNLGSAL